MPRPKGVPDDQIMGIARTPEAKSYVQNALAARVKAGVERVMAGALIGRRPVRLDVTVRRFEIAGPLMSILIGGGRGMVADTTLVDARTGAVIISSPKEPVALPAGSGLLGTAVQAAIDSSSDQSVTDKIIATFGQDYRRWLLRETSQPCARSIASPLHWGHRLCLKRRGSAVTLGPVGV